LKRHLKGGESSTDFLLFIMGIFDGKVSIMKKMPLMNKNE
jgi:hypothetical protein